MKTKHVALMFLLIPLLAACSVEPEQNVPTKEPNLNQTGTGSVAVQKKDYPTVVQDAKTAMDASLCDELSVDTEKQDCKKTVSTDMAISKGEEGLCNSLEGVDQQNCLFSVTITKGIQEKNTDACSKLTDTTYQMNCKDQIYANLAYTGNDPKMCEKIQTDILKTSCLETLKAQGYMELGDVEKCDTLSSENLKTDCLNNGYFNKAVQEKNKELCQKITYQPQVESCLKAVGQ